MMYCNMSYTYVYCLSMITSNVFVFDIIQKYGTLNINYNIINFFQKDKTDLVLIYH